MSKSTVQYAISPSRQEEKTSTGPPMHVGYDVFSLEGHNAEQSQVFLWLKYMGWSRTLAGAADIIARHQHQGEGSLHV